MYLDNFKDELIPHIDTDLELVKYIFKSLFLMRCDVDGKILNKDDEVGLNIYSVLFRRDLISLGIDGQQMSLYTDGKIIRHFISNVKKAKIRKFLEDN